jgi:predicted lipoprotein
MLQTKLLQLSKFGLLVVALSLTACYSDTNSRISGGFTELDRAVEQVIDHTIIPTMDNMQVNTKALNSLATQFCGSKSTANLSLLQDQWKATNQAWYKLLPFTLGPLEVTDALSESAISYIDSHRDRGNDYKTSIRTDITAMLALTAEDLNATYFSSKNFTITGLLALELLAFERSDDQDQDNNTILAEYVAQDLKCNILQGQSTELLRRIELAQSGWKTNYRDSGKSYRDLLINKELESSFTAIGDSDGTGTPAFTRIIVSMQAYYDYLGKRNVITNSASVSGTIWPALSQSAIITSEVLSGTDATTLSLYELMSNGYEPDVVIVKENIITFESSITNEITANMVAAAKVLDGNLKREIPEALNIALGLNFNDGD